MSSEPEVKKLSPYTILNRWLSDRSYTSPIPDELISDKSINVHYILYHFRFSHYIILISRLFNNYYIYSMDRLEMFKCLKQCILSTGYQQKFITRTGKTEDETKLGEALLEKFPLLNSVEIEILTPIIEARSDYDAFCETLGLKKTPQKRKNTVTQQKQFVKTIESSNDSVSTDVPFSESIRVSENLETLFS